MSKKKTISENKSLPIQSELLLYQTEDEQVRIEVRLHDETVWMTQAAMADLYQTTPQNITTHLKAIYEEGELDALVTCEEYLQVQNEGARRVSRILTNAGKVSKTVADQLSLEQYKVFHQHRLTEEAQQESLVDDAELKRYLKRKK